MVNIRRAKQHFAKEAFRASSAPNCGFSASQHGLREDLEVIGVPILLAGVDADPEAVHEALKAAARKRPSRDLLVRRLIERTMRGFRSSSSNGYPLSVPEMRVGIG